MSKHTPEPWRFRNEPGCRTIKGGFEDVCFTVGLSIDERDEANASRIVACVNACAEMENPTEEIAKLKEENKTFRESLDDLNFHCGVGFTQ